MIKYTRPSLMKHFEEVYKRQLTDEERLMLDFGFCYGVNYEKHLVEESVEQLTGNLHLFDDENDDEENN